jgi:uncharacterized coiled-coil protein SlyX
MIGDHQTESDRLRAHLHAILDKLKSMSPRPAPRPEVRSGEVRAGPARPGPD